jgi:predicted TIM-barrel fold metal-dependent hydrolase
MANMQIIDAHAHVFDRIHGRTATGPVSAVDYGRVRVGGDMLQLLPPIARQVQFLPGALIACMDWAGVDRAVLLQGPFYGPNNGFTLRSARKHPTRLTAAAFLDPWNGNGRPALRRLLGRGFRIVKLELSVATGLLGLHPGNRLDDEKLSWLWGDLEAHNCAVVLDLGAVGTRSYQTDAVDRVARLHPSLRIVIAHLGQPRPNLIRNRRLHAAWLAQIRLGRHDNVWFDTSALPYYYSGFESYPYPTAGRYLRLALRELGPEKLMWGTDSPALLGCLTYKQMVELATQQLLHLSKSDQKKVLGENAASVLTRTS